ncbi:flagellar biosynthesis anti-sigma factor FlgM (plasmid) [Rossellomorea sp. AcN35-11]|nr:flagellar biosynthesis anti-sigma factor FlgM [Rossellomorea aquimaris]WJV32341.1 flagellar biosynthesis anti-sigma factor FlgM [Rossellomorea sp. AcN35-11]
MKINPSQLAGLQTYRTQSQPTRQEQTGKVKEDRLEISSATREMHTKFETERHERVQALKQQVENGEYKVDPSQVAKNMISFWSAK